MEKCNNKHGLDNVSLSYRKALEVELLNALCLFSSSIRFESIKDSTDGEVIQNGGTGDKKNFQTSMFQENSKKMQWPMFLDFMTSGPIASWLSIRLII